MERLVRDFGDLSEIESNAVVLRAGVHDAGEMVELAAESARQNLGTKNVKIAVERPDRPVLVRCDRERMLRAFAHVVENAVRFAPDGSAVVLRLVEDDDEVSFAVEDHGDGLSDETRAHLYDRAWHASRADRVGAGLGLAIANGVVLAHEGAIDVRSEPGSTTFALRIPKGA
jgi:signal transduction histidine kinase